MRAWRTRATRPSRYRVACDDPISDWNWHVPHRTHTNSADSSHSPGTQLGPSFLLIFACLSVCAPLYRAISLAISFTHSLRLPLSIIYLSISVCVCVCLCVCLCLCVLGDNYAALLQFTSSHTNSLSPRSRSRRPQIYHCVSRQAGTACERVRHIPSGRHALI